MYKTQYEIVHYLRSNFPCLNLKFICKPKVTDYPAGGEYRLRLSVYETFEEKEKSTFIERLKKRHQEETEDYTKSKEYFEGIKMIVLYIMEIDLSKDYFDMIDSYVNYLLYQIKENNLLPNDFQTIADYIAFTCEEWRPITTKEIETIITTNDYNTYTLTWHNVPEGIRKGQHLMSWLYEVRPQYARVLNGTNLDCFHNDSKIYDTLSMICNYKAFPYHEFSQL